MKMYACNLSVSSEWKICRKLDDCF